MFSIYGPHISLLCKRVGSPQQFILASVCQPLLRGPQVLHKQSLSAPQNQKKLIHNLLCFKMKFDSRYEEFSANLFSGALQTLRGWETLFYAVFKWELCNWICYHYACFINKETISNKSLSRRTTKKEQND